MCVPTEADTSGSAHLFSRSRDDIKTSVFLAPKTGVQR